MKTILGIADEYAIIPGIGVKNEKLNSLISFCIGYGLEWLVVLDRGYNPDVFIEQLKKSIVSDESTDSEMNKIYTSEVKEIEDLFCSEDIKLLGFNIQNANKTVSELIGKDRKILFAQKFKLMVENHTITKEMLNPLTLNNFELIFKWIEERFK